MNVFSFFGRQLYAAVKIPISVIFNDTLLAGDVAQENFGGVHIPGRELAAGVVLMDTVAGFRTSAVAVR
jgi:hypothetical protein